jgi:phosphoglycerate dehydrogenase-like enzyme
MDNTSGFQEGRMKRAFIVLLLLVLYVPNGMAQTVKKVVITSLGPYHSRIGEKELAEFRAAAPNLQLVVTEDKDRILTEVADADGILGTINPEIFRAAKKLQWVQVQQAGVEGLLFPELKNSKGILTNCKITQGPEIADHAFAMLLSFTRELYRIIPRRMKEEWLKSEYQPIELRNKTAVIVGMGGIGTNIAQRAKGFGMQVIGLDPKEMVAPTVLLDQWHPPDRLDEILPEADVLFIAAPSTRESTKMIGARQFGLMKKTAYFICVSRGRLYDMDALVKALETKQIAGAGLDVTDPLEPLPSGHPLWKFENVILTPHIAGRSDGEFARYMALFKENLRRFGRGENLIYVVDKQKGY